MEAETGRSSIITIWNIPLTKLVQVQDLQTSGIDTVLRETVHAIVGAIALQKGGDVANQIVRQRILSPLGLT